MLHLLVGMPGAGKTTVAQQIVEETGAVHLDPDVWLVALGLPPAGPRDRFEELMFDLALDLVKRGVSVVIETGGWIRSHREAKRRAAQALGTPVELHVLDVPLEERWRRIARRNEVPGAVHISRAELEEWEGRWEPVTAEEQASYDSVVVHGIASTA
jgi:predicted kinase